MNSNKTLSFISGLGLSVLLSGIVYYQLFLETFDLFGIQSLRNPELRHAKIFYTALSISLLTLFISGLLLLKNRKNAAFGFSLPVFIAFIVLFRVGVIFFDKSNYYADFDQKKWAQTNDRIKMARKLVKDKVLSGLSRDEVIRILGDDYSFVHGEMNYKVYGDFCGLGLSFKNGKVTDYGIWVDD